MKLVATHLALLFTTVVCGPCPDGFTQAANGGDCFKTINFYDSFIGQIYPKTYDEAESYCNSYSGAMLASIHTRDENNLIQLRNYTDPNMACRLSGAMSNIGLRCKGTDCKWDDGTPLIYENFEGDGPSENDGESCYAMYGNQGEWRKKKCGQQTDCWICKVKARTIDCVVGEVEYKGGCVSIQTAPLDEITAKTSCPRGGYLPSIHGGNDITFYRNAALNAGLNGTIYIGGEFVKGVFEWTDGSHINYGYWANGFPNIYYGYCVQMLLDSSFGVQGQWTNVDCSTKQPYFCFRDGATFDPNLVYPREDETCPSFPYYYEDYDYPNGNVYSSNYPISIPATLWCSYNLQTSYTASIKFLTYDCVSGCTIELRDPRAAHYDRPFITFNDTHPPVIGQYYSASSIEMTLVFSTTSTPVGTGWQAKYTGLH